MFNAFFFLFSNLVKFCNCIPSFVFQLNFSSFLLRILIDRVFSSKENVHLLQMFCASGSSTLIDSSIVSKDRNYRLTYILLIFPCIGCCMRTQCYTDRKMIIYNRFVASTKLTIKILKG